MQNEKKELLKKFKAVIDDLMDHYDEYTPEEKAKIKEIFQKVAELNTILDKYFFLDLEDMDPPAEEGYDEETDTEEEYVGNQEDDSGMEEYSAEEPYAPEDAVYEDPVEEYVCM